MMIGRDIDAASSRRSPRAPRRATPLLEVARPRLGATGCATSPHGRHGRDRRPRRPRRPGPARAAAGAVRRAARRRRRVADRRPARCAASPGRRQARRPRHGADPGGPQDRGPDAADVGARQPQPRRARRGSRPRLSSIARPRSARSTTAIGSACDQDRRAPTTPVGTLSGGNQQKVVIAKWLMTEPGIILLNDPTRGIDVGTKQEIYRLMRELADEGAAILFYSTDYDELIGCCDRVVVLYDGASCASSPAPRSPSSASSRAPLNIADGRRRGAPREPASCSAVASARDRLRAPGPGSLRCSSCVVLRHLRILHPRGFTADVCPDTANKGVLLALVAMAQTAAGADRRPRPLGRRGDDAGQLLASPSSSAAACETARRRRWSAGRGRACGLRQRRVVVYGRLQPIIATLATGADLHRHRLCPAADPGGDVDEDLAGADSNLASSAPTAADGGDAPGPADRLDPGAAAAPARGRAVVWLPFRRSVIGRGVYAVGSSRGGGLHVGRRRSTARKLAAYTLAGFLAGDRRPVPRLQT